MLIELFGENFGSFRDEFRLSMLATDIDPGSNRGIVEVPLEGETKPLRLLRAAAIYGPNASGKSTVLRAGEALQHVLLSSAMLRSNQKLPYYVPFALEASAREKPVMLGMRGIVDQRVYEYRTSFFSDRIVEESLTQIGPEEDVTLFHRVGQEFSGQWASREQFKLLSIAFRPNASLLSLADAVAPDLAQGIAVGLGRLLSFRNPTHTSVQWFFNAADPVAKRAEVNKEFGHWLRERISDADIGVVDYETEEMVADQRDRETEPDDLFESRKSYRMRLIHEGKNETIPIPFAMESQGTRQFLSLTPYFFDLSHAEGPLAFLIDELDASLHPVLLEGLIDHFNRTLSNEKIAGQLIFATHATDLMDSDAKSGILRRDQIWFTEKDRYGASRLYSLVEFKVRGVHNTRKRYLQGRYGAIPSLGDFEEDMNAES